MITLDRTGHTEQKLIETLADPKKSRDQKDYMLSMYLFERGKESASFLADLFRYKGEHTKESRVFQSRMRFDFESFVNIFVRFLQDNAFRIGKIFKISIAEEKTKFEEWLKLENNRAKGYTYPDYHNSQPGGGHLSIEKLAMIEQAIYQLDQAEAIARGVEQITLARMAQKGFGIYVDKQGRTFDVNEPGLDEIIKQDREIQDQAEREQDGR